MTVHLAQKGCSVMQEIRVLLVDDEEEFASALAERLNMRGIRTLTAFRGEDALRMLESDPPQVVLLDIMMPGMGGKEIFERIRLEHPGISVIFLSGQGCAGDRPGVRGLSHQARQDRRVDPKDQVDFLKSLI